MLIAGVNLYALAIVLQSLLGVNLYVGIVVSAAFVLVYIGAGGLSSAIYGEVLQFFVILAGLIPLTIAAVVHVGGFNDLGSKVINAFKGNDNALHAWAGTGIGVHTHNPIGADFIGIVLGLGFVLSFGYWTTNFAEVQRALSAKDESAMRRTPIIAAYPKLLIPAVTIIPGLVAVAVDSKFGTGGSHLTYNDAIPKLMGQLLPSGVLGIAITGLFASFMAGVAANVSSLNTVVTYDLLEPYLKKGRSDRYYLNAGRVVTVIGIVIAVFTAILASHFNNIMTYLQSLFSIFNAPIFATFILGMFWKKTSAWGGFWGLLAGVVSGARDVPALPDRRVHGGLGDLRDLHPGRGRVRLRHRRDAGRHRGDDPARPGRTRRHRLLAQARQTVRARGPRAVVAPAGAARQRGPGHRPHPERDLRLMAAEGDLT